MPRARPYARPLAQLGPLLTDAVRLLRRDFHQRAHHLNLTPALARLLYNVHRVPGSSQVDLAGLLEIRPVTVSRMVDRLVRLRYVRRVPDPLDRRIFRVHVDRAGEALLGRMSDLSVESEARALAGLSARERGVLARQLALLCRNLSGPAS